MDPTQFSPNAPGTLVPTTSGMLAFRPAPLPPELEIDWAMASRIESATLAVATLAGAASNLPNPHLLIRPFVRREAVLSSRIEGTRATLSDLAVHEAGGDRLGVLPEAWRAKDDVAEVRNSVRALEQGVEALRSLPVSLRLLRMLHATLMEGVRGGDKTPGEFRRTQVHIGAPGEPPGRARFVPPPPGPVLAECLDEFEKHIHAPSGLPRVVRYALLHYQFEAIHPFTDGNGRIGRLLFPLLMMADGLLPQPLLYISAYFEGRRGEYYDRLLAVSTRGAWSEWILFVLAGIEEQARDALRRSQRILALREEYRTALAGPRSSALASTLVEHLFLSPITTRAAAAEVLGVTPQAAAKHIEDLLAAGVLVEITGRARNRVFAAQGILKAIEEDLPPEEAP